MARFLADSSASHSDLKSSSMTTLCSHLETIPLCHSVWANGATHEAVFTPAQEKHWRHLIQGCLLLFLFCLLSLIVKSLQAGCQLIKSLSYFGCVPICCILFQVFCIAQHGSVVLWCNACRNLRGAERFPCNNEGIFCGSDSFSQLFFPVVKTYRCSAATARRTGPEIDAVTHEGCTLMLALPVTRAWLCRGQPPPSAVVLFPVDHCELLLLVKVPGRLAGLPRCVSSGHSAATSFVCPCSTGTAGGSPARAASDIVILANGGGPRAGGSSMSVPLPFCQIPLQLCSLEIFVFLATWPIGTPSKSLV